MVLKLCVRLHAYHPSTGLLLSLRSCTSEIECLTTHPTLMYVSHLLRHGMASMLNLIFSHLTSDVLVANVMCTFLSNSARNST